LEARPGLPPIVDVRHTRRAPAAVTAAPTRSWASFRHSVGPVHESLRIGLDNIAARCSRRSRLLAVHGADEGNNLPDLIGGDSSSPGRHAVGSTLHDGVKQILGFTTVDPFGFDQWRPNAAATMR